MVQHNNKVEAFPRADFGKGAARKLRAAGRIPAVLYGHGTDPQHLSLPGHEMSLILRQTNALIELQSEGKDVLGLVKDVQKDPVRQIIEHIDLLLVKKGEKVLVDIPILLEGESAPGTMVMHDLNNLSIEAEATNIPNSVTIDVEGMEEGTVVRAGEIVLPKGSTLIGDPEEMVLSVEVPTVTEEEPAEAAEETVATEEAAEEESAE